MKTIYALKGNAAVRPSDAKDKVSFIWVPKQVLVELVHQPDRGGLQFAIRENGATQYTTGSITGPSRCCSAKDGSLTSLGYLAMRCYRI